MTASITTTSNPQGLGAIILERELHTHSMKTVSHAQFTSMTHTSSSQPDGVCWSAPGSSNPLPLAIPSGVSRPQFLVAAQAASLPCVPSYQASEGGTVLDRVVFHAGGERWWTTLTGRAKAGKVLTQRKVKGWKKALLDQSNYALCHNTSIRLPQQVFLRTRVTYQQSQKRPSPPLRSIPETNHAQDSAAPMQRLWTALKGNSQNISAAATLRRKLKSCEIRAEALFRPDYDAHDGRCARSAAPFQADVDIRSSTAHSGRLHYKLGVQHLVTVGSGRSGSNGGTTPAAASTHLQAAVALHGVNKVWTGHSSSRRTKSAKSKTAATKTATTDAPASNAASDVSTSTTPGATPANSGAAPSGSQSQQPRGKVLGPHNPIRQVLQKFLRPAATSAEHDHNDDSEERGSNQVQRRTQHHHDDDSHKGSGSTGGERRSWHLPGVTIPPLPHAEEVQESVMDATQSIKRLREDVQSLSDWVSSGNFTHQLDKSLGPSSKGGSSGKPSSKPSKSSSTSSSSSNAAKQTHGSSRPAYSSILGSPHLHFSGLAGLYLRQPLWLSDNRNRSSSSGGLLNTAAQQQSGSGSQLDSAPTGRMSDHTGRFLLQTQGDVNGSGSAAGGARNLGRANSLSADLVHSSVAWLMSAAGSLIGKDKERDMGPKLGLFASLGASCQLGWFQRPVLDFTRLAARLDLGMLGKPTRNGPQGDMPRDLSWMHRTLPCWHALTLSMSQQLIGPVRLCADLRYGLDMSSSSPSPSQTTLPGLSRLSASNLPADAATFNNNHNNNRSSSGQLMSPGHGDNLRESVSNLARVGAARAQQVVTEGIQGARARVIGVKPSLLDAVVGLDVTLPGTSGFARLFAWYAPYRGEAMLELRLL